VIFVNIGSSNVELNPTIELINTTTIKFEEDEYHYSDVDSILNSYKNNVPHELKDSIRIHLVVIGKDVTRGNISDVKNSLVKVGVFKVLYELNR